MDEHVWNDIMDRCARDHCVKLILSSSNTTLKADTFFYSKSEQVSMTREKQRNYMSSMTHFG